MRTITGALWGGVGIFAMSIDGTVTVGNLMEIGSIIIGAMVLYSRLTTLETKIQPIWEWWNSSVERRRRSDADEADEDDRVSGSSSHTPGSRRSR